MLRGPRRLASRYPAILCRPSVAASLLGLVATVIAGLFVQLGRKLARDRVLLRAALTQAPDFHYVKDPASRFMAVNQAVAAYTGSPAPPT